MAQLFDALAARVSADTGRAVTPESLATGYLQIAVQNMANAIKRISVARGYDVTQYTLQCFGGAGGQHACGVADALGMSRVFVHPLAGVLSAYGMGLADQIAMREASIERPLDDAGLAAAAARLSELGAAASDELASQGVAAPAIALRRHVHVRYQGTDTALVVPFGTLEEIGREFEAGYRQRFAFLMPDRPLVIEAVSVEAVGAGERFEAAAGGCEPPPHRAVGCCVVEDDGVHRHLSRARSAYRPQFRNGAAPVRIRPRPVVQQSRLRVPVDRRQRTQLGDEDAALRDVLRGRAQAGELVLGRQELLEAAECAEHQVELLRREVERPHVALDQPHALRQLAVQPRLEPRQHRQRGVESDDAQLLPGQVQRDPPGPDAEFQRWQLAAPGELLVHREVVVVAVVDQVVQRGQLVIAVYVDCRHRLRTLSPADPRARFGFTTYAWLRLDACSFAV